MKNRIKNLLIWIFTAITLCLLSFPAVVASSSYNYFLPITPNQKSNVVEVTISIDAIIRYAESVSREEIGKGVRDTAFYINCEKLCYAYPSQSATRSPESVQIPLTYDMSKEIIRGEFIADAPGRYIIQADLSDGQIKMHGEKLIEVHSWEEKPKPPDEHETPGQAGDSNGDHGATNQNPPVVKPFPWISILAASWNNVPQAILLCLLIVSVLFFVFQFYITYVKRLPGSFVIVCESGAARAFHEVATPKGRSITLYRLLAKTLRQYKDGLDEQIIQGIIDDDENRRNLNKIRICIRRESGKESHYAIFNAGGYAVINDTKQQVYPDIGRLNAKLTVSLSFVTR